MKTSTHLMWPAVSLFQWWNGVEKLMTGLYRLYEREPEAHLTAQPHKVSLADGEVLRLEKASGIQKLRVRQGRVWLTRTPADGDILLKRGDEVELDHGWPIVVQSLENHARVDVWR